MAHRALMAAVGLVLAAGLIGCGYKKKPDGPKADPGKAAGGRSSQAWERGKGAVPTGEGRTELQKLAVQHRQLKKLGLRKKLPFKSIASLGWSISTRSRDLVEAYELANRKKVAPDESKEKELKAQELPEDRWINWPESIRDLERVAINAKGVALAAGTWEEEKLRQKLKDLSKVADRCLPSLAPPATVPGAEGPDKK
jgi:hypothetical protein